MKDASNRFDCRSSALSLSFTVVPTENVWQPRQPRYAFVNDKIKVSMCTFLVEQQLWALLYSALLVCTSIFASRSFSITFLLFTYMLLLFFYSIPLCLGDNMKKRRMDCATNRRMLMKRKFHSARLASNSYRYAQICASRRHHVTAHGKGIFLHSYVGK